MLALLVAAALVLAPFWPWLVLAIWIGVLGRRMVPPLAQWTGRRQRAVAVLTALLLTSLLVPVGFLLIALVGESITLVERLTDSERARAVFETLVSSDGTQARSAGGIVDFVAAHSERAWDVIRVITRVATKTILGVVVFIAGTYVVMADGPALFAWLETHLPMAPSAFRRLASAFMETGRALMFGVIGAGSAQAALATAAYVVIGVPRPLVLGFLTLFASIVPAIGTAFVWGPVAIGLALTGRTNAAIGLGVFGIAVIGTVDNLARPWLARWAELKLHGYLIMVAMFGGISLLGPQGLLLGPLALRLAKEALILAREERPTASGPREMQTETSRSDDA